MIYKSVHSNYYWLDPLFGAAVRAGNVVEVIGLHFFSWADLQMRAPEFCVNDV